MTNHIARMIGATTIVAAEEPKSTLPGRPRKLCGLPAPSRDLAAPPGPGHGVAMAWIWRLGGAQGLPAGLPPSMAACCLAAQGAKRICLICLIWAVAAPFARAADNVMASPASDEALRRQQREQRSESRRDNARQGVRALTCVFPAAA